MGIAQVSFKLCHGKDYPFIQIFLLFEADFASSTLSNFVSICATDFEPLSRVLLLLVLEDLREPSIRYSLQTGENHNLMR